MSVPAGIGAACVEFLAVDGAAVLLMSDVDGRWEVAATVGRLTSELEQAQLTVGEGPGVEAYRSGGPVLVADVATVAGRWPGFAELVPAGVLALASFPLHVGAVQFGVLDVYRDAPGRWEGTVLARALQLADSAAEALLLSGPSGAGDALDWLDALPRYAAEIDQAAGVISVQLAVSLPAAYARLRGYAFSSGRSLVEVAREVVDGQLRLDDHSEGLDGGTG